MDEFKSLSEEQLVAVVNGCHQEFVGRLRAAIKDHARAAGAALHELKRRVGHGKWEPWLTDHCEVSPATARVYMRVARDWDKVAAAGLDRPDVTLEEVRAFLADPGPDAPPAAPKPPPPERGPDGEPLPPRQAPPRPKHFPLYLEPDRHAQLTAMLDELGPALGTPTPTDTAFEAVRRCHEREVARG